MADQPNEPKQLAKTDSAAADLALTQQSGLQRDEPINLTHLTMRQLEFIGKAMVASGAFSDVKSQSQALVRILAGQEMGLGPFAAMSNINIINGSPAVGGHIMAARVKASQKYDYQVIKWDKDICSIDFFQNGKKIGNSTFDKSDATSAGLVNKDNWRKFPRNMYFNRAISNGVRTYCPDVLGNAPVYDPDELGARLDEQGNVIEMPKHSVAAVNPAPEPPVDEPVDSVDNSETEEDEIDEVPVDDDTDLSQAIDDTLAEDRVDMPKKPVYDGRPDSGLPRPQQRKYYKEITAGTSATALKEAAQDVINKDTPTTYDDFEAMINFITTGELPGQQDLLGDQE